MGDVADRIHGHPHAIPGPPECSVAFGAPCPAGLALVSVLLGMKGFKKVQKVCTVQRKQPGMRLIQEPGQLLTGTF